MNRLNVILLLVLMLSACAKKNDEKPTVKEREDVHKVLDTLDYEEIKARGKLVAVTHYNSTAYFIYKGQLMGFEYELLRRAAEALDLPLEIVISNDIQEMFHMLDSQRVDVIGSGLTITRSRNEILSFTTPLYHEPQVLVQRKPEGWKKLRSRELRDSLLTNPEDLIGKTIHVHKNSAYAERLNNLQDEVGGDIDIVELTGQIEPSELIDMVNRREIDYTVVEKNIGRINASHFEDLDVSLELSIPTRIAWGVRKESPALLDSINGWLEEFRKTTEYAVIYNKYFKNRKAFLRRYNSDFFSIQGDKISPYDDVLKEYSKVISWDWRLLASLVYQESRFDPKASSWVGAQGLMQVMPNTATQFKVEGDLSLPSNALLAGTRYLRYLEKYWSNIPDEIQRQKFILASYNVGQGHIDDAQRLAKKHGDDPLVWDDQVEKYILLKEKAEYYKDPVVKFGYCRGKEPYHYVREIFNRYENYRQFISK